MIRLDVGHPVGPLLVGNGQVVSKNLQRDDLKLVQLLNRDVGNSMPSLVAERMIVQPLVREHAPKNYHSERRIKLQGLTLIRKGLPQQGMSETIEIGRKLIAKIGSE